MSRKCIDVPDARHNLTEVAQQDLVQVRQHARGWGGWVGIIAAVRPETQEALVYFAGAPDSEAFQKMDAADLTAVGRAAFLPKVVRDRVS